MHLRCTRVPVISHLTLVFAELLDMLLAFADSAKWLHSVGQSSLMMPFKMPCNILLYLRLPESHRSCVLHAVFREP